MVLLQGPRGALFLVRNLPLYVAVFPPPPFCPTYWRRCCLVVAGERGSAVLSSVQTMLLQLVVQDIYERESAILPHPYGILSATPPLAILDGGSAEERVFVDYKTSMITDENHCGSCHSARISVSRTHYTFLKTGDGGAITPISGEGAISRRAAPSRCCFCHV